MSEWVVTVIANGVVREMSMLMTEGANWGDALEGLFEFELDEPEANKVTIAISKKRETNETRH